MRIGNFIWLICISWCSFSQEWSGPIDSANEVLLKNRYVEIEATQAMFDMYNFNFDRAARQYNYLKKQYGWHPLPYFLLGLNEWWKLMPYGMTDETKWDDDFLLYMDSAQVLAERLFEEGDKIEGAFFLSAVHGFRGRLYSDRGSYVKAAFEGKNALKYLDITRGQSEFSPEILFGDGLFNYYAKWIREHYPYLRPLMSFFPDGDKELGIKQLKEVARNAFYSRTEAQYYLMRIMYAEEGDIKGSLQIAKYLIDLYPNNAYFHRFYARLLYQNAEFLEAEKQCLSIIERIDLRQAGYEWTSGRYASFFLGHIYELRNEREKSKKYYEYAIEYGKLAKATESGYYIFSHVHLGDLWMKDGEFAKAMKYYKTTKKITKRKHSAHKQAVKKIAELKKLM